MPNRTIRATARGRHPQSGLIRSNPRTGRDAPVRANPAAPLVSRRCQGSAAAPRPCCGRSRVRSPQCALEAAGSGSGPSRPEIERVNAIDSGPRATSVEPSKAATQGHVRFGTQFASVGVDDGDGVQVVDEDAHDAAVVLVAQADVVQVSAVAQGDAAAGDLVVADAPVSDAAGGDGLVAPSSSMLATVQRCRLMTPRRGSLLRVWTRSPSPMSSCNRPSFRWRGRACRRVGARRG